ncbi:MAG TPA: hypothetical protein VK208_01375 [Pyrinomonadaceae bacterium]|nr:hypothetical protein [Pyrinomonadaceae bacterium]
MKSILLLAVLVLASQSLLFAQMPASATPATKTVQQSQSIEDIGSTSQLPIREFKLPARTALEVEVAYTVNSLDLKPGERISFRVLVPIVSDGVTLIEKGALVTARVTESKRGGHWGKAGKLAWSMEDVVAVDNSRVPLAPETAARDVKLWSLEATQTNSETKMGQGRVKGTSHGGEVAAMTIVSGVLFPPLALMNGFKRGENAILREGRRFVVAVGKDSNIKIAVPPTLRERQ